MAVGREMELEARHNPTSQAVLMEYVLALGLYHFDFVTEIFQTAATCLHNIKFGRLWRRLQVYRILRRIKHVLI